METQSLAPQCPAVRPSSSVQRFTHVFVRDLVLECRIGINHSEFGRTQPLIISVEVAIDYVSDDRIEATLDYNRIAAIARDLTTGPHIGLVETFAHELAEQCVEFERVVHVSVEVRKPQAIAGAMAGVRVDLSREQTCGA